jgi:hypothetical protein
MVSKVRPWFVVAGLLLAAVRVSADQIDIYGNTAASTSNLGNFTGNISYNDTNSTTAQLIISLTNTSAPANGGFLTAFVFNNPGDLITGVSLSDPNFKATLANNTINGAPFGQFDIAASLAGNPKSEFTDGGNPSSGIGVGDSGTFTFNLSGTRLDTLTAASFVADLSSGPGDGSGDQFFVARFRGFLNGGSDKVPGSPGNPNGGGNPPPPPGGGGGGDPGGGGGHSPVPEPSAILLWAVIGGGLICYRRRSGADR